RFSRPRASASSGSVPSRRFPNGAPCWPTAANSSSPPLGSSPSRVWLSSSPCSPSILWVTACATRSIRGSSEAEPRMDAERINVIIGALGTVVAAFVGVLTWYLASRADRRHEQEEREAARRNEEAQREQRVLDLVVALHSEI